MGILDAHSCCAGEHNHYLSCFEEIIQELQLRPLGFQRLWPLRLEELLLAMARQRRRLENPQLENDGMVAQVINDKYGPITKISAWGITRNGIMSACAG